MDLARNYKGVGDCEPHAYYISIGQVEESQAHIFKCNELMDRNEVPVHS